LVAPGGSNLFEAGPVGNRHDRSGDSYGESDGEDDGDTDDAVEDHPGDDADKGENDDEGAARSTECFWEFKELLLGVDEGQELKSAVTPPSGDMRFSGTNTVLSELECSKAGGHDRKESAEGQVSGPD